MQPKVPEEHNNGTPRSWRRMMVPLAFLAVGIIGFMAVMTWSTPGNSHGASTKKQLRQKGPMGPRYGQGGPRKKQGRNRRPVVETRTIEPGRYQHQWKLYGEIVAGRRMAMHIPVSGRLIQLSSSLRAGATFKKGDLLAAIDDFPYRMALEGAKAQLDEIQAKQQELKAELELERLSLEQARRQLTPAQRELKHMQKLFETKAVANKTLDDAKVLVSQRESALQQRQSNIQIIKTRLRQQEAAEKRQQAILLKAERAIEDSRFHAPYDGHVLSVDAEIGQYVNSTNKLATLVSGGDLEVRFTLSQDQYGTLLASRHAIEGLPVRVIWRSGQTRIAFDGEVKRVVAEVAENSGSIILFAEIGKGALSKEQLPIGSFVDISLSSQPIEKVVNLPESVLYEQNSVFLVKDGKLVSRQVQPLSWKNGEVMIVAGLDEGDQVLVTHLPNAKAGMSVDAILR
jgi:multidrug resistance efflux pump